jgi:hypothetical protein
MDEPSQTVTSSLNIKDKARMEPVVALAIIPVVGVYSGHAAPWPAGVVIQQPIA